MQAFQHAIKDSHASDCEVRSWMAETRGFDSTRCTTQCWQTLLIGNHRRSLTGGTVSGEI